MDDEQMEINEEKLSRLKRLSEKLDNSITIPGSSEDSKVLYIPAASTKFLGTSTLIPLKLLTRVPIGDPECQIPSSL